MKYATSFPISLLKLVRVMILYFYNDLFVNSMSILITKKLIGYV
jgi:hypothetical protein